MRLGLETSLAGSPSFHEQMLNGVSFPSDFRYDIEKTAMEA